MSTPAFLRPKRAPLAACLVLLATNALAAAPEGLSLRCVPASVTGNEEGMWALSVRVVNLSGRGVYGDSMALTVLPIAPGGAAAERRLLMPGAADNISTGDSIEIAVGVPASTSSARLVVRFFAHQSGGQALVVSDTAVAQGSVFDTQYPSMIARVGGQDVELVKLPADAEAANGAGVLLLPGEDTDARGMLVAAARLARNGISVVIVGAPGQGRSQGHEDFAGPASRAAALAGLDTLLHMKGVEATRVGAWGISRGGTLALVLALEKPAAFHAVAAQAASYDLWATWRTAAPADRAAIEAAAGRDSAGWRARSPLLRAAAWQPALLVVHGEADPVAPAAGAHAFADATKAAGRAVTTRFLPAGRHALGAADALRFLTLQLGPPR